MGCCYSHQEQDLDDEPYLDKGKASKQEASQNENLKSSRIHLTQSEGQKLKILGNEHFKNKRYKKAIQAYREALETQTVDITYYTNLALALKADHQYKASIETIDRMQNDPHFDKQRQSAIYSKGLITRCRCVLLQSKDYCTHGPFSIQLNQQCLTDLRQCINCLQKLSKDNSAPEVTHFLHTAQQIQLLLTAQIMPKSHSEHLLNYLTRRFEDLPEGHFQLEHSTVAKYFESPQQILGQLGQTVKQLKEEALQQQKQELLDPITYQVLSEPVVVPSGTSYNQTTLKQHFKNNGYNDPITHQLYSVGEKVLVPNFNIKDYCSQAKQKITADDLLLLKY